MTALPARPLAPPDDDPPRIVVTYRAICPDCGWEGPDRASSLTSLDDYDKHVKADAHRYTQLALVPDDVPCLVLGCLEETHPIGHPHATRNGYPEEPIE